MTMARLRTKVLPPLAEHERLEAMLAELRPFTPEGLALQAEWQPACSAWSLWVSDQSKVSCSDQLRFNRQARELAEKHGLDIELIPVEVANWD
jgi:hypothetical protein